MFGKRIKIMRMGSGSVSLMSWLFFFLMAAMASFPDNKFMFPESLEMLSARASNPIPQCNELHFTTWQSRFKDSIN